MRPLPLLRARTLNMSATPHFDGFIVCLCVVARPLSTTHRKRVIILGPPDSSDDAEDSMPFVSEESEADYAEMVAFVESSFEALTLDSDRTWPGSS